MNAQIRQSLISTTYFTLLGKRAQLFTKSRKGTTLNLQNVGLYFVLGLMLYFPLDKWKLVFCVAVQIKLFGFYTTFFNSLCNLYLGKLIV